MKPIISIGFKVEESEKKLPSFLYSGIIQAVLLFFSTVGALQIFLKAFGIPMVYKELKVYIIVFMVFFYLIYFFRKAIKYTLPISIVIYLLLFKMNFDEIKEGCFHVLNLYIRAYNKYSNMNLMPFETTQMPEGQVTTTFLLFAIFAIMGIISFVIARNKMPIFYFIATLPLIIAVLSVGMVPDYFYFAMYVVGGMGVVAGVCVKEQKGTGKSKAVFQSAMAMMVLLSVAWFISLKIMPEGTYDKEQSIINAAKKDWQEAMTSWDIADITEKLMFKTNAAGGVGEGILGRFSEVKFKKKVMFEVTLPEYLNNLYLRSYVGATYTGSDWKPLGEEGLGGYKQVLETLNAQGFTSGNQSFLFLEVSKEFTSDQYEEGEITIKDMEQGEKYKKAPYYGEFQENNEAVKNEIEPFLNQEKPTLQNKYYGYYYDQNEDLEQRFIKIVSAYRNVTTIKNYMDYLLNNTLEVNNSKHQIKIGRIEMEDDERRGQLEVALQQFDEYTKKEKQYRDLVYDQYLGLPENSCRGLIKEWAEKFQYSSAIKVGSTDYIPRYPSKLTNLNDISDYVKEYLNENTSYTLNPGSTPKDKDFLEYFLTENKKGYCSYYATAATIMFRSMGVPARYVEGYVVTKSDIMNGTKDGEGMVTAMIKDTNAHAWTEIYLDGFGWVPVDTTPGYLEDGVTELPEDITNPVPAGNGTPTTGADIPEIPVQNQPEEAPIPKEPSTNNEEEKKPGGGTEVENADTGTKGNRTFFLRWAMAIIILAFIYLAFYMYWRICSIKKEEILTKGTAPDRAKVYYKDINSMIKCVGKKIDSTTDNSRYIQEFRDIFPSIEESIILDCIKVMEKISFSNQEICETDVEKVMSCYKLILKTMYFRINKIQRIKLKYLNIIYPILWNNDSGTRNTI